MEKFLQENSDYATLDKDSVKAIKGILELKIDLDTIKIKDEEGREVYK